MNKYINIFLFFILSSLPLYSSSVSGPTIANDDDWSVPSWVETSKNSGFFSENSASNKINLNFVTVFDIAWKQINPSKDVYTYTTTATVKDMPFSSFSDQNKTTSPFWMRIWNSGVNWAPSWIQTECSVGSIGTDYDGDSHLPIWNSCVWNEIKKLYKHLFLDLNMRADPRLKFIYVPGAFNWCEFDFTEIGNYSTTTGYSYSSFNTWFQGAMQDLVDIFGPYSYKLVYTGEDYPFDVDNWPAARNLLARDAVSKGMGIRNGITELFNFHLDQIPAYGITIDTATGYLNFNKSWLLQANPNRVIGTENECYNACGFKVASTNLYYAIKMSQLKALQMGVNWLYLVESDSYVATYPNLYNWIKYSLGKQANNSFDAWATLRNSQDTFWTYDDSINWPGKPYIKNLERFLTQRDIKPNAYTKNGSVLKKNIYTSGGSDNGQAYEGRQTNIADGNTTMSFFVDDDFAFGNTPNISIKVTYNAIQSSKFIIRYQDGSQILDSSPVTVSGTNGTYYTATFNFSSITLSNSLSQTRKSDFEIVNTGTSDIEVLFVRIIKLSKPSTNNNNNNSSNNASSTPASTTSSENSSSKINNESDSVGTGSNLYSPSILIILLLFILFNLI